MPINRSIHYNHRSDRPQEAKIGVTMTSNETSNSSTTTTTATGVSQRLDQKNGTDEMVVMMVDCIEKEPLFPNEQPTTIKTTTTKSLQSSVPANSNNSNDCHDGAENNTIEELQRQLQETQHREKEAYESLRRLAEGVRLVARQMRTSSTTTTTPSAASAAGTDDIHTAASSSLISATTQDSLPTTTASTTSTTTSPHRGRAYSGSTCGSFGTMMTTMMTTTKDDTNNNNHKDVVDDNDRKIADLSERLDGSLGADLLGLSHAANMVHQHAQLASQEASWLTDDMAEATRVAADASIRAAKAEAALRKVYKEKRSMKQQLQRLRTERKVLVKEVKTLRQENKALWEYQHDTERQEMMLALEHHVAGALIAHERHMKDSSVKLREQHKKDEEDEEEEKKEEEGVLVGTHTIDESDKTVGAVQALDANEKNTKTVESSEPAAATTSDGADSTDSSKIVLQVDNKSEPSEPSKETTVAKVETVVANNNHNHKDQASRKLVKEPSGPMSFFSVPYAYKSNKTGLNPHKKSTAPQTKKDIQTQPAVPKDASSTDANKAPVKAAKDNSQTSITPTSTATATVDADDKKVPKPSSNNDNDNDSHDNDNTENKKSQEQQPQQKETNIERKAQISPRKEPRQSLGPMSFFALPYKYKKQDQKQKQKQESSQQPQEKKEKTATDRSVPNESTEPVSEDNKENADPIESNVLSTPKPIHDVVDEKENITPEQGRYQEQLQQQPPPQLPKPFGTKAINITASSSSSSDKVNLPPLTTKITHQFQEGLPIHEAPVITKKDEQATMATTKESTIASGEKSKFKENNESNNENNNNAQHAAQGTTTDPSRTKNAHGLAPLEIPRDVTLGDAFLLSPFGNDSPVAAAEMLQQRVMDMDCNAKVLRSLAMPESLSVAGTASTTVILERDEEPLAKESSLYEC